VTIAAMQEVLSVPLGQLIDGDEAKPDLYGCQDGPVAGLPAQCACQSRLVPRDGDLPGERPGGAATLWCEQSGRTPPDHQQL